MIICVGPKSSGKTLLLRRLQQSPSELHCSPYDEIFSTISTVGVNIATLPFPKHKTLTIREMGGAMAAIWPLHFSDCAGVMFVIDASDISQISCACILLLEALEHVSLENAKILVVLNKTDLNSLVDVSEIKYLLRLDDVCETAKQEIVVIECSCLTGKGVKEIKQWLQQFAK